MHSPGFQAAGGPYGGGSMGGVGGPTSAPAALRVPEHSANGMQRPNAARREQVVASPEGSNALPTEGRAQSDKELPPNWMAVPSFSRPGPLFFFGT
jgi:hypothetical protein